MPRRSQTKLSGRSSASEHEAHSLPLRGGFTSPIQRILLGYLLYGTFTMTTFLLRCLHKDSNQEQRICLGMWRSCLQTCFLVYINLGTAAGSEYVHRTIRTITIHNLHFGSAATERTRLHFPKNELHQHHLRDPRQMMPPNRPS